MARRATRGGVLGRSAVFLGACCMILILIAAGGIGYLWYRASADLPAIDRLAGGPLTNDWRGAMRAAPGPVYVEVDPTVLPPRVLVPLMMAASGGTPRREAPPCAALICDAVRMIGCESCEIGLFHRGGSVGYLTRAIAASYQAGVMADPDRRPLRHAVLAARIDWANDLPTIIGLYANMIRFGDGLHGLGTAACARYGRPAETLSLAQATTLAVLSRRPDLDGPQNVLAVKARRDRLLTQLVETGQIDLRSGSEALAEEDHPTGVGC